MSQFANTFTSRLITHSLCPNLGEAEKGTKEQKPTKKPRVASAWKEAKICLERISTKLQITVIYDPAVMNGRIRG